MYRKQTFREGMHTLQERPVKDHFRHDATSWMALVHQLAARPRGPASGCPAVIMVQPTHHRKSDHLVACILRERNQSALFRDLLPNPLMGSCSVEVHDIRIQDPLELLFLKNQQMEKRIPAAHFSRSVRHLALARGA